MKLLSTGNNISVMGKTYHISEILKKNNFKFNKDNKIWIRENYDPSIYYLLDNIINNKISKRITPSNKTRCTAQCKNGFRCTLKKTKKEYCKIHYIKYNLNDPRNLKFL